MNCYKRQGSLHHVLHVAVVEACKRDAPRLQQVDVVLADQALALWSGQSCMNGLQHKQID